MKDKQKRKKERTWAEAARMVLENFSDAPMTPKQILHVIETKGLKEMRSGTSPLACLNTMLHSQCRGEDGMFFKLPGRLSLFTLKKDALQWSKNLTVQEGEETEDRTEVESCDSTETTTTASAENDVSLDETSSSASCSTEPQNKLSRAAQHPQTGRQRKKGVLMPRVVLTPLKVNGEHVPSGFPGKRREAESSSSCSSNSPVACSTSLHGRADLSRKHGQHFKAMRKAHPGSMKRTRGVEVDFETPGSILVNTNIRALINTRTFAAFPPHCQQQLLLLLPEVDRQVGPDGLARLSSSALNNEFFAHASQCWKERLGEGEFTHEMQARFRQEMEKEKKVEPWKEKFFEDYYGQRSGLTKEESLRLTTGEENSENQAGTAPPVAPPKRRATGRRRKDGRVRRRSRPDLRRRARRTLCKQPKAQEEKGKPFPAAASSAPGVEASSQVELQTDPNGPPSEAPAETDAPVPAAPLSDAELSPRLPPDSASCSLEGQEASPAVTADALDHRAILAAAASARSLDSGAEVKDQKRKSDEPAASTSFPEKKPRLDQSFRNTIDCVHSEKPQPTKEEPKVPPIRIQLSRIKPPWVVKGPPTYQICPRIIPNSEAPSRGRTGARTLADIKARAQQARAQREAAAAVAATGEGAGPGGGPGGGGGREHPEPFEPGGGQGTLAESSSQHHSGAQLLQAPAEVTVNEPPAVECLETCEIAQWGTMPRNEVEAPVPSPIGSPTSPPGVLAHLHAEPAEITPSAAADPGCCGADLCREEAMAACHGGEPEEPADTENQVVDMETESESCVEEPRDSEEAECRDSEAGSISVMEKCAEMTVLAPTSIPDTLPRFGARGIDAIRTLTSFHPLEGGQTSKELNVDKCKNGGKNGFKVASQEPSFHTSIMSGAMGFSDASRHTSGASHVELERADGSPETSACVPEDSGLHSDSTETASDFEDELSEDQNTYAEADLDSGRMPDSQYQAVHLRPANDRKLIGTLPRESLARPREQSRNAKEKAENGQMGTASKAQVVHLTGQRGVEAPKRTLSSGRQVSSVEANNPLVTQLLQGSLPLEKVLPLPHSVSKLEISRVPLPPHASRESCPQKMEAPCFRGRRLGHSGTGGVGESHKACTSYSDPLVPSHVTSNGSSPFGGQTLCSLGQMPAAAIPKWQDDAPAEEGRSACLFEETGEVAASRAAPQPFVLLENPAVGGGLPLNPPASSKTHPGSAAKQSAALETAENKERSGVQAQRATSEEYSAEMAPQPNAGKAYCSNTSAEGASPPQNGLCSADVVPTVKINWLPKQSVVKGENHPSCQTLPKNSTRSTKEAPSSAQPKDQFPAGMLNMEMALIRLAKEPGKPSPCPLEASSIPFQLSIQQQFYGKLPRLQYGPGSGFSYTANMSVVDTALTGLSKNIANSVMQLRQRSGFAGGAHAALSIQAFAESSMEEVALKCSCRLKAMIMCKGCGAFCHDDCIGPSKLCVSCLVVR
ncbi:polycomb group protein ASXL1 [Lepisosteus oculatus]|uniref:polycomb group protein ASXL1 n=1 Tax=Lepisosteus oculatus TaxID=7918 RepID=UPI0035F52E3A